MSPFSKILQESPSFVIFPLHEIIFFILNTGSSQGCSPHAFKLKKTIGEDLEREKALDLKCSSLFGWRSIFPTPKKTRFCSFLSTVQVETLITDWSALARVLGSHRQFLLVRPTFACEVGFMQIQGQQIASVLNEGPTYTIVLFVLGYFIISQINQFSLESICLIQYLPEFSLIDVFIKLQGGTHILIIRSN